MYQIMLTYESLQNQESKTKKDNLSSNVMCPDYYYYFADCKKVIAPYAHMPIGVGPRLAYTSA